MKRLSFGQINSGISRRGFITSAMTAIALPNIITSSALGAEDAAPASERLTIGLIGTGKQMGGTSRLGGGHLGTLLGRKDCQIVAVCDVESKRLGNVKAFVDERYAQRDGNASGSGCAAYKDYRELLARD